jgi:hypothetical protein
MEVPFLQTKIYGCGFYSLANLFNEEKFLEFIVPNWGSSTECLNRALRSMADREILPYFWVNTLFCVNSSLPVQNRFLDSALFDVDEKSIEEFKDNPNFRAYLLTVKGALFHQIAVVQNYHKDIFYVFDSLHKEVKELSRAELIFQYWIVEILKFESEEIMQSWKVGCEQLSLFFNYSAFPHIKQ